MNTDFLAAARANPEYIRFCRESIHAHPELGNQEQQTAAFIEDRLLALGLTVERPFGTAVVATLRGGRPGKTVALRADMDALPLTEATGAAYSSQTPGVMHACGHDVHVAGALGAAALLASRQESIPGTVRFLFQPDEEGDGGAQRLVEAGCMAGVDAVFGGHVSPDLPAGMVGVRAGKFYAASDMFTIRVTGKSAHGATPERGIDALQAAAALALRLHALPAAVTSDRCILTVGSLHAGTAGNILAGEAELKGILRTLGPETRTALKKALRETIAGLAAETGTVIALNLRESYPGVVTNEAETALAERSAAALFGAENVLRIPEPTMTTEDFGYYLDEAPGTFYHLGAGCSVPLHNPAFLPDADAPVRMAALHAAVILNFLTESEGE